MAYIATRVGITMDEASHLCLEIPVGEITRLDTSVCFCIQDMLYRLDISEEAVGDLFPENEYRKMTLKIQVD
jgi:hypothetical protein